MLSGRIMKAERLYGQNRTFVIAVKLESVVVGGISRPLKATPDSGARRFAKGSSRLTQRVDRGPLNTTQDHDGGIFEFQDTPPNFVIKSGLASNWVKLGP